MTDEETVWAAEIIVAIEKVPRERRLEMVAAAVRASLRQIMPIAETMGVYGKHIATFSPDVAAALVAVADELRNAYDVGAVAEWIDVEGDGPKSALVSLAKAMGCEP